MMCRCLPRGKRYLAEKGELYFPPLFQSCFKEVKWVQLVKALAAYSDSLSSAPRAYVVEGNSLGGCPLTFTCGPWHLCTYVHAYTHGK